MLASVQIADVGAARALRLLSRPPKPGSIPGLLHADVATASPLRRSNLPRLQPGRVALYGFWETEDDLDRFLSSSHPFASAMAAGWQARLEPIRAFGSWPGLPEDTPRARTVNGTGPVVVLTVGRTRMTGLRRFLATSLPAERRAREAPGLVWGAALARPPFFSTCSIWKSAEATTAFAYGQSESAHPNAIAADRTKPFHHQQAFIRFRPLLSKGGLGGTNPLPEEWLTSLAGRP